MTFSAPTSLAHTARQREHDVEQEELLTHCRHLETEVRRVLRRIDATKTADPQWLAAARMDLNKGLMCLVRSITRQDFF